MPIDGIWYNELGSVMTIQSNDSSLTGTYQTAVGDAQGIYQLVGSLDPNPSPPFYSQAVAWAVMWVNGSRNSHSVTAWSGQYHRLYEEIDALWLLTDETLPGQGWRATMVNKDTFTRTQPSAEAIAEAMKRRPPSHPVPR